jgi:hypothetical protein
VHGFEQVWPFTVDDSGIVYAYAKHLAAGQGFRAVVGGPTVEGYSDFAWVMLVTVAAKLGFAPPVAAKVLGAALFAWGSIAAGFFVHAASGREDGDIVRWTEVLPAILLATCPEFVVWGPSGLENALYFAGMTTALWLDVRENSGHERAPASAVVALCITLTRPEGIVYAGVLLAAKCWDRAFGSRSPRGLTRFVATLFGPLFVYEVVHYAVFRHVVPNTYFAKAPGASWSSGLHYVMSGVTDTRIYWVFPLVLVSLFAGLRRTLPALGFGLAALSFAAYSGGDWMPHSRFVALALPPFAALASVGASVLANCVARRAKRPALFALSEFACTLGISVAWYRHHEPRFERAGALRWCHFCSRSEDAANHELERKRLALRAATFLTHDFGGASYASSPSFMPIDLLGLCDEPAAQIQFRARREGRVHTDLFKLEYFFHEHDRYPTLLYFPDNFWPGIASTPEFRLAYMNVTVPAKQSHATIAFTRLFRGSFVDFFPPVDRFDFESIGERFELVGSSGFYDAASNLDVFVSLIERRPSVGRVFLSLRVRGEAGESVPLFGAQPEIGAAFRSDEPLLVRLQLAKNKLGGPDDVVELGVSEDGGKVRWLSLFPMSAVHPAAELQAPLPFPNDLPGTDDEALRELGRKVQELVRARYERSDLAMRDSTLAASLRAAGDAAFTRGVTSDAYLAWVWATQADSDLVRSLGQKIAALRPIIEREPYLMEHALLGQFYSSADPFWQLELSRFYARRKLADKARFFAQRFTSPPGGVRGADVGDISGLDSDFETPRALGWSLRGKAFHVVREDGAEPSLWGFDGHGYLTSEGARLGGDAESAPFALQGRALSFLVAGRGGHGVAIDLVVAGKVVAHATGPDSRYFTPVFWDLSPYVGETAVLKISDRALNQAGFIAVDDFRMWRAFDSAQK